MAELPDDDEFLAKMVIRVCTAATVISVALFLAAVPLQDPVIGFAGLSTAIACAVGVAAARTGYAAPTTAALLFYVSAVAASSTVVTPTDEVASLASTPFAIMFPVMAALMLSRRVTIAVALWNWGLYTVAYPITVNAGFRSAEAAAFQYTMLTLVLFVTTSATIYFKERDSAVVEELHGRIRATDRVAQHAEQVAEGDLTVKLGRKSDLESVLADMLEGIRAIVAQVDEASHAALELTDRLADLAESQEQMLDRQHDAVGDLMVSGKAALDSAQAVAGVGSRVSTAARETLSLIGDTDQTARELAGQTRRVEGVLIRIKAASEEAEFLSLNAQLEGVRAGRAGRGFALIAEEMVGLTANITRAARELAELNGELEGSTNSMTTAMSQSIASVERTVEDAGRIATLARDQHQQANQVTRSASSVQSASDAILASQRRLLSTVEGLSDLTTQLNEAVKRFRL